MRCLAAVSVSLALAGCAVTSERPLFTAADAAAHPLAQGDWALHGPGCEVAPGQPPPECAIALTVRGDRMIAGGDAGVMASLGPMAAATGGGGPAGTSEFVLAEGDPQVLQLHELAKPAAADGQAPATPQKPGHRSYMAFRPLHQNAEGRSDRGILWLILCPKDAAAAPGITTGLQGCEATTPQAVLDQAKHVPPMFSFFMTWIGPGAAPAQSGAMPGAKPGA